MRVEADGAGIICGSRRAGLPDERFASRSEPSCNPLYESSSHRGGDFLFAYPCYHVSKKRIRRFNVETEVYIIWTRKNESATT